MRNTRNQLDINGKEVILAVHTDISDTDSAFVNPSIVFLRPKY